MLMYENTINNQTVYISNHILLPIVYRNSTGTYNLQSFSNPLSGEEDLVEHGGLDEAAGANYVQHHVHLK